MNRIVVGTSCGVVAGVVDVVPMIFQKLPWEASASAFVFWIVTGILIAVTTVRLPAFLKGVFVAVLGLLPIAILVAAKEPMSLIPMSVMSVLLGAGVGYVTGRFGK